jgi:PleD family two-component response regulator
VLQVDKNDGCASIENSPGRTFGAKARGSLNLVADTRPYSILVVDESVPDVFLLERALARRHVDFQLTHLRTGAEALAFVRREAPYGNSPCPDLILVDLKKAKIDGSV